MAHPRARHRDRPRDPNAVTVDIFEVVEMVGLRDRCHGTDPVRTRADKQEIHCACRTHRTGSRKLATRRRDRAPMLFETQCPTP